MRRTAVTRRGLLLGAAAQGPAGMNILEFEETLARARDAHYRHPKVDVLRTGFRPVGGNRRHKRPSFPRTFI